MDITLLSWGNQMNKFFLKLKLKFSKNNLRQFKNSFNDDFDSIKYDTTLIKRKVLNPSSSHSKE